MISNLYLKTRLVFDRLLRVLCVSSGIERSSAKGGSRSIDMVKNLVVALLLIACSSSVVYADEEPPVSLTDKITYYFTPFQAEEAEAAYLALLGSAEKTIRLNEYGFTDPDVCDVLVQAEKRGVDVQVTMDSTEAAGPAQKPMVNRLKHAGVTVLIGKSPVHSALLHAKFAVVDGSKVEWGSWNNSPSASQQFNTLSFVTDSKVATLFTEAWQKIADHLKSKE